MVKYIAKRILLAIVTIWAVGTLTFFLMNMVPGGPFLSEKAISPQAQAALEAKYGLDKPLIERYVTYLSDALHGDFGDSLKQRGRTVMSIIIMKFPVSARVGGISVLVALCVGIPLGCMAALKRGKFLDSLLSVISTCGIAVPSFVICTLLMYIFGVNLKLLPTMGLSSWKHYIMPVIALSFYPSAYIMRLMRSSMLDVLEQDYMRTAKAKGVAGFWIIQTCSEKCDSSGRYICRSDAGLYGNGKFRCREDFRYSGTWRRVYRRHRRKRLYINYGNDDFPCYADYYHECGSGYRL